MRQLGIPLGLGLLLFIGGAASAAEQIRFPVGQSYALVKKSLVSHGWSPVPADRSLLVKKGKPYGYDEMICGAGWQAECSANFVKAGHVICILLKPQDTTPVYLSTWPEC